MYTFTIKSDSIEFDDIIDFYSDAWQYAKVGDSIIKPADTLMIIIKMNDSTSREFLYKSRSLISN